MPHAACPRFPPIRCWLLMPLLVILALSGFHVAREQHIARQALIHELQHLAEFLAPRVRPLLNDPSRQREIRAELAGLQGYPGLLYVGIHHRDGGLANAFRADSMPFLPALALQDGTWRFTEQYLELSHPVVDRDARGLLEVHGRIYLRADRAPLRRLLWDNMLMAALGGGLTLLLAMWLGIPPRAGENLDVRQSTPLADPLPEDMPPEGPPRVLLAEDNAVNSRIAKAMIENAGCEIQVVPNGQQAVEVCQQETFDLIFMDCHMPEVDGYDATRQIRAWQARQGQRPTPIIALSGNQGEEARNRCQAAGMDELLTKPFSREQLETVLRQWTHWTAPDPQPGTEAEEEEPVLEENALRQIRNLQRDNSPDLLQKVIAHYLRDSVPLLDAIRQGLRQGDLDKVYRAVHTLKSSSANLGANRLADLCRELETQARENAMADGEKHLAQLTTEHRRVCEALKAL